MDYFLPKTDPQFEPPTINYFALVDPSIKDISDGVLVSLPQHSNSNEVSNHNEEIRKVGLVQGVNQFVRDSNSETLSFIELNDQRILFVVLEERYNAILSIRLGTNYGQFTMKGMSPECYLTKLVEEGYDLFRLHNGSIGSLVGSMSLDEVSLYLTKWWSLWLENLSLGIAQDGFIKTFTGYRRSLLRVDSEIQSNLEALKVRFGFKECLLWNSDDDNYENYGLVYEHYKNLSLESKVSLLNWVSESGQYGFIPQSMVQPVVIRSPPEEDVKEQVYDPFKLVWSTLGDVSKATGITSGVDAGLKTLNEGVGIMNQYLPWLPRQYVPEVQNEVVEEKSPDIHYLIGKIGNSLTFKNIYLTFEDTEEKLHRLVAYKYYSFVVILIFDFSVNTLNSSSFYEHLELALTRIGKEHFPPLIDEHKTFYYVGYDQQGRKIESNIPMVPKEDEGNPNDSKYFYDLSLNQSHSIMVHKEVLNSDFFSTNQLERLTRSTNGWWIYQLVAESQRIIIIKKWKFKNTSLLESSANIVDTIGVDAKLWLDDYLSRHHTS